jgi:hypothetical protein
MADQDLIHIENLLKRARNSKLIQYGHIDEAGETITLQIGRVLYTTDVRKATSLIEDALHGAVK